MASLHITLLWPAIDTQSGCGLDFPINAEETRSLVVTWWPIGSPVARGTQPQVFPPYGIHGSAQSTTVSNSNSANHYSLVINPVDFLNEIVNQLFIITYLTNPWLCLSPELPPATLSLARLQLPQMSGPPLVQVFLEWYFGDVVKYVINWLELFGREMFLSNLCLWIHSASPHGSTSKFPFL